MKVYYYYYHYYYYYYYYYDHHHHHHHHLKYLAQKGWPIKVSLQKGRYFNPSSQVALHCVLSDWVHVQRSTDG